METSGPPRSLRERRKIETRALIHAATLELIEEHGFDAVTVDMISEHAGVSPRTFFNYFTNKEAATIESLPPLPEQAVQDFLDGPGAHDLLADLGELATRHLQEHDAGPSNIESTMRIVLAVPALVALQLSVFAELETQYTALIAARLGLKTDDERPELIAAVFLTAVRVASHRWTRRQGQRSLAEEIAACLTSLAAIQDTR